MAEIPRVKTQRDAALMLRVTPGRLRQMEIDAPWWRKEFRTDEGYDPCEILRAQYAHNSAASADSELAKRKANAEVESAEQKRNQEELRTWEMERAKAQALGNILPADVYQEFIRELLGLIRVSLSELPFDLAMNVPPDIKHLFMNDGESPLEIAIEKLNGRVDEWLKQDPKDEAEPE